MLNSSRACVDGKEHNFIRLNKMNWVFDAIRRWSATLEPNSEIRNPCRFRSKSLLFFFSLHDKQLHCFCSFSWSNGKYSPSVQHQVIIIIIIISIFIRFQFTVVLAVMLRVNAFLLWSIYLQLVCSFFFPGALHLQNQFSFTAHCRGFIPVE